MYKTGKTKSFYENEFERKPDFARTAAWVCCERSEIRDASASASVPQQEREHEKKKREKSDVIPQRSHADVSNVCTVVSNTHSTNITNSRGT